MSATQDDPVTLSLDILRRLPPANVKENVEKLMKVMPNEADDLASSVDQPLTLQVDDSKEGAGREFLCCDYNRDGASWRSWYSNQYFPPITAEEGEDAPIVPTGALRELELHANDAFETYRKLYYETGYTSTYLWDMDSASSESLPTNFAGVVLFKKDLDTPIEEGKPATLGTWDSIHVFEVSSTRDTVTGSSSARYKISSSVMLSLQRTDTNNVGLVDLGGSLTRQTQDTCKVEDASSHISNLGRIIEDIEGKIRNQLQEIYFGKMEDIVNHLRSTDDLEASRNAKKLQEELVAGWERA